MSAIALIVSQYVAGFLFLWSIHADQRAASPLTIARYGYYYGDRQEIRRRIWSSSVVAFAIVLAAAGIALLPRARSLHGDARFATRGEIARHWRAQHPPGHP